MSKLNIDQKTIRLLLTDKHSDFLIPDYQRPYAWGEDECATLWDDLFPSRSPNDDCDAFDSSTDEYFLGPIVTFKNAVGQLEIIDGQQRLTTIMLLLRTFYDKFASMKDKQSVKVRESIAGCVWKTDEFDEPDMGALKIDSEVASDADKGEFLDILRHGTVAAGVVGGGELDAKMSELENQGARFEFSLSGGKATGGRSAWWLKGYPEMTAPEWTEPRPSLRRSSTPWSRETPSSTRPLATARSWISTANAEPSRSSSGLTRRVSQSTASSCSRTFSSRAC